MTLGREDVFSELAVIAYSSVNVLVTANHADDRMTWALAIHEGGLRRNHPFVSVRLAMNPPVRAATVDEWLVRAAGGTLFIDDVGQLGADAQARLSSTLSAQSGRVNADTRSNGDGRVRVIAGSGRSLRADLAVGAFNDTLFYRLNVIHLDERSQDPTRDHTMKARDVTSAPPYTCGPHTDLAAVAQLMWDHDCGFVPVVAASGAVVGVVTDRDICIAASARRRLPEHLSAAQVMTSPIRACMTDDSISDVLATMTQFQVRRVPVVDAEGRLQAVISLSDIVRAANERGEPQASAIVSTMAAICAHRPHGTVVA